MVTVTSTRGDETLSRRAVASSGPSGTTTFPDGTVVEVKPLSPQQALMDIGEKYLVGWTDEALADAWNASIYAIPRDRRYLRGWKAAA